MIYNINDLDITIITTDKNFIKLSINKIQSFKVNTLTRFFKFDYNFIPGIIKKYYKILNKNLNKNLNKTITKTDILTKTFCTAL